MKELIGVWKLLFLTGGGVPGGYSPNVVGRIMFTAEGWMDALITDTDPIKAKTFNWGNATAQEIATIARPVVTYCGQYTLLNVSGELFTHTAVEASLNPGWVGTDQIRHVSIEETNGTSILTIIPVYVSTDVHLNNT